MVENLNSLIPLCISILLFPTLYPHHHIFEYFISILLFSSKASLSTFFLLCIPYLMISYTLFLLSLPILNFPTLHPYPHNFLSSIPTLLFTYTLSLYSCVYSPHYPSFLLCCIPILLWNFYSMR